MWDYITGTELRRLNLLYNVQVQKKKLNSIKVISVALMLIKLEVLQDKGGGNRTDNVAFASDKMKAIR